MTEALFFWRRSSIQRSIISRMIRLSGTPNSHKMTGIIASSVPNFI